MPHVISVNLGVPHPIPDESGLTGIDKRPADGPVPVRAPGPKRGGLGSGLVGDRICNTRHHGGDDQAVYAFAREDLDTWTAELGREVPGGGFGENLTTSGLDVTGARIGERWRVGDEVVLQVTTPRIPCGNFARFMAEKGWVKRFTERGAPGAYLRVLVPGEIRAGDPVEVVHVPGHGVTIGMVFGALMGQRDLLTQLLAAEDDLPGETRDWVRRKLAVATG